MDPGVESEAADRVIDVRSVAAKENASASKLLGDTLVHVVEIEMQIIALRLRDVDPPEAGPYRGVGERFLVALVLTRVVHRAPAALQVVAGDLEEVGPFLRIGHVVAIAAVERGCEIELRGD